MLNIVDESPKSKNSQEDMNDIVKRYLEAHKIRSVNNFDLMAMIKSGQLTVTGSKTQDS